MLAPDEDDLTAYLSRPPLCRLNLIRCGGHAHSVERSPKLAISYDHASTDAANCSLRTRDADEEGFPSMPA